MKIPLIVLFVFLNDYRTVSGLAISPKLDFGNDSKNSTTTETPSSVVKMSETYLIISDKAAEDGGKASKNSKPDDYEAIGILRAPVIIKCSESSCSTIMVKNDTNERAVFSNVTIHVVTSLNLDKANSTNSTKPKLNDVPIFYGSNSWPRNRPNYPDVPIVQHQTPTRRPERPEPPIYSYNPYNDRRENPRYQPSSPGFRPSYPSSDYPPSDYNRNIPNPYLTPPSGSATNRHPRPPTGPSAPSRWNYNVLGIRNHPGNSFTRISYPENFIPIPVYMCDSQIPKRPMQPPGPDSSDWTTMKSTKVDGKITNLNEDKYTG